MHSSTVTNSKTKEPSLEEMNKVVQQLLLFINSKFPGYLKEISYKEDVPSATSLFKPSNYGAIQIQTNDSLLSNKQKKDILKLLKEELGVQNIASSSGIHILPGDNYKNFHDLIANQKLAALQVSQVNQISPVVSTSLVDDPNAAVGDIPSPGRLVARRNTVIVKSPFSTLIDSATEPVLPDLKLHNENPIRVSNGLRQTRVYVKLAEDLQEPDKIAVQKYAQENNCKVDFFSDSKGVVKMKIEPKDKLDASAHPKEDQIKAMSAVIEKLTKQKPDMDSLITVAKTKISSNLLRVAKGARFEEKSPGVYKLDVRIKVGSKHEKLSELQQNILCDKLINKINKRLEKAGNKGGDYKKKYGIDKAPEIKFIDGKLQVKANADGKPLNKKLLGMISKNCNNKKAVKIKMKKDRPLKISVKLK